MLLLLSGGMSWERREKGIEDGMGHKALTLSRRRRRRRRKRKRRRRMMMMMMMMIRRRRRRRRRRSSVVNARDVVLVLRGPETDIQCLTSSPCDPAQTSLSIQSSALVWKRFRVTIVTRPMLLPLFYRRQFNF
jgi:hypothetical protein